MTWKLLSSSDKPEMLSQIRSDKLALPGAPDQLHWLSALCVNTAAQEISLPVI